MLFEVSVISPQRQFLTDSFSVWENKKNRAKEKNRSKYEKKKNIKFNFYHFQGMLHYLWGGNYYIRATE